MGTFLERIPVRYPCGSADVNGRAFSFDHPDDVVFVSDAYTKIPSPTRPGMREVARRAGVAMSSVSRVLSGHPDVSPRMRQVVMNAVRDLGYRPDMLAQGLR